MITVDFVVDTPVELVEKFAAHFRLDVDELKSYFISVNPNILVPEVIVRKFDLNLNKYDSNKLSILCRHITTANEESLDSFKEAGILNLREMFQEETPLSNFLKKHEIEVNVDKAIIKIGNREYPILQSGEICPYCYIGRKKICTGYSRCDLFDKLLILASKLFYYNATVECFINTSLPKMKRYSTICRCPEILGTLDKVYSVARDLLDNPYTLCNDWISEKKDCYLLLFPVLISEMVTFEPISFDAAYDDIRGCLEYCGYTDSDYYEKKVAQDFYNNYYFMKTFISIYFFDKEIYGSLLFDMSVAPDVIKFFKVDGDVLVKVSD
ncbi:MAG: hypothetical protein LLF75_09925 [Eubacteriales bacterium]|nr:hypothetical protein [Eubacteriales bacterium]